MSRIETAPPRSPPDLRPEPGWVPVEPFPPEIGAGLFVSGGGDRDSFQVAYYGNGDERAVVGKAWFGPATQGPPGHAHGGSLAALLDEVMGAAAWHAGYQVLAGRLCVDFRRLLPLGSVVQFAARVSKVAGRQVHVEASLFEVESEPVAAGEGVFVQLSDDHRRRFLRQLQDASTSR